MNVRKALIFLILALIVVATGLVGFGRWLLTAPEGTAWLLTRIIEQQNGRLGSVEGTLAGQLQLSDLQLHWPGAQLNCQQITLKTQIDQLFPLRLEIGHLQLVGLQIDSKPTEQKRPAASFNWPQLPGWLAYIEIDLKRLELQDIRFQNQQADEFKIEQLHGQIAWRDQHLQLNQLALLSPDFKINGNLSLGFALPVVKSDFQIRQLAPDGGEQKISVTLDLKSRQQLLLAGPVDVSLTDSRAKVVRVSGDLGLTSDELLFQQLSLHRPAGSGTVTATGRLRFTTVQPELESQLQLNGLDLLAETGQSTRISGRIALTGTLDRYQGSFDLHNQADPLYDLKLSGRLTGDRQHLDLAELRGHWLNGTLSGQTGIDWNDGWQVTTQLAGRNLDPHLLHDQMIGQLNIDLNGEIGATAQGPAGQVSVNLHESLLHGQSLTGAADLSFDTRQVEISSFYLRGDGFELQAAGNPNRQIELSWHIDRLEQLLTDWRGQLSGTGRVGFTSSKLEAQFSSQGAQLGYRDWQLSRWQLSGTTLDDQSRWQLSLKGDQLSGAVPSLALDRISIDLTGGLDRHSIKLALSQPEASLQAVLQGRLHERSWQGELTRLIGRDAQLGHWQTHQPTPLTLSAKRLQLGPLKIDSEGQGSVQLQGYFLPPDRRSEATLEWHRLNLGLLNPWLAGWEVSGNSNGSILLQLAQEQRLHGQLSLQGQARNETIAIDLQQGTWLADWNDQGLESNLSIQTDDGGVLTIDLSSVEKPRIGWPEQGKLQARGQGFNLAQLRPWLPPELTLKGLLDWQGSAQWQTDQPWSATGAAEITEGHLLWSDNDTEIDSDLTAARLNWTWRERLSATVNLELRDHGRVDGQVEVPIAAALPLRLNRTGAVAGQLNANLRELGLLSMLYPDKVQDSRGQLKIDLQLAGTWDKTALHGNAQLLNGSAFLPPLGIQLENIELHSVFDKDRMELKTLRLSSGGGSLTGQGRLKLENWQPQNYRLKLEGERLLLINLPDLLVRIAPDLTIDGDHKRYRVSGLLTVNELLAKNSKKTDVVQNSPDLVIVDDESAKQKSLALKHDIELELILGDKVLIDSSGIDAKLDGRLQLRSNKRQELVAFGEIQVEKGKYSSYGVSLNIDRGYLFFNGGPLDQPSLDVLALRRAGEVKAGVKVTGTVKQPIVKLYSEPVMPDTDILSYIVLGRRLSSDSGGQQQGLLMTAAGALLSQGESVALQEKLKSYLGLDVLDINAGDGDVNSSIITTGKYLNPDLYISLGYSLFSNTNEVKVRYNLSPDWELESTFGTESGVDLFYKIDIQ